MKLVHLRQEIAIKRAKEAGERARQPASATTTTPVQVVPFMTPFCNTKNQHYRCSSVICDCDCHTEDTLAGYMRGGRLDI
jgi:hypothetical protein